MISFILTYIFTVLLCCQNTGRESPLPVGPIMPVKSSSDEEEAERIQQATEAEKEV